jgi:hypothetical protein
VVSNISHWTCQPNHDLATCKQIRPDENREWHKLGQTSSQHSRKDNKPEITAIKTNEEISQRKINSQGTHNQKLQ